MKKEKEKNTWRRKISVPRRIKRTENEKEENIWSSEEKKNGDRKRSKIFEEGKYLQKENILKKENIWSAEEMKNGEGKGGNYSEKESWCRGTKTWVAGQHCYPESFCASGKFLHIEQKKTFLTVPILSKSSGFFQMISNFPDSFKTVRIFPDDCQFSGSFQNCPDFSR